MRPLACLVAVLVLAPVLGGCGGGGGSDTAQGVLSETAEKLGELESGDLTLRLVGVGTGESAEEVGIELAGPFALGEPGQLPVAEIDYTEIGGSARATATFISTGEKAFVRVGDTTYELPAQLVERLRREEGGAEPGLGRLDLAGWLVDPELSEGERVDDGTATDRVSARLDVVAAVNDVIALVDDLGAADLDPLEGESAEQLERSVRSSRVVVLTGSEDRLLRRLTMEVELGVEGPPQLADVLGALGGGGTLAFDLAIANPNEPVEVEEPTDAEPYPAG